MEHGEDGDTLPQGDGSSLSEGSEVSISNGPEANPFIESWIQILMQMRVTSPQVQRGIPVYRALQEAPLKWARNELGEIHALTRTTSQFHEFWSHSWRTKAWLKYINILFLNNGLPAFVIGTLFALTAFFLSFTGLLPVWAGHETGYVWCTPAGIFGYYLTLLFWRSRKLAFLDIACINQTDGRMKAEALVSMGAFLKESKSLLVLWDATYVTRLWCVFELGAFLHSKGPEAKAAKCLQVCPVFVGPAFLAGHLGFSVLLLVFLISQVGLFPWGALLLGGLAFPCLVLLADLVLAHCRSIEVMQHQVRDFTIEQSKSACCSRGHVDANGGPMLCDRRIILRCISAWFGSKEKFESAVRGQLLQVLVHQLANRVFSYWRIVQITAPAGWAILDTWCDNFKRGSVSVDKVPGIPTPMEVLNMVYSIIFFNFMLLPMGALILLRLAYAARHVGERRCTQILLSLGLVKVGALLAVVCMVLEIITADLLGGREESPVYAIVILSTMGLLTLFFWRCLPAIKVSVPDVSRQVGHSSDIPVPEC